MLELNKSTLEAALKQMKNYVSASYAKPVLNLIHMFTDGDKVVLEATDSYIAMKVEIRAENPEPLDITFEPFTLPKSFKDDVMVRVDAENGIIEGTATKSKVFIPMKDAGRYPDLNRVMDVPNTKMVCNLKVDFLKRILAGLKKDDIITISASDSPMKPLTIHVNGQVYENKILACTIKPM